MSYFLGIACFLLAIYFLYKKSEDNKLKKEILAAVKPPLKKSNLVFHRPVTKESVEKFKRLAELLNQSYLIVYEKEGLNPIIRYDMTSFFYTAEQLNLKVDVDSLESMYYLVHEFYKSRVQHL